MEEIGPKSNKINVVAPKLPAKRITPGQGSFNLGIEKDTDVNGIGMGVLSDGTPYLNQRGLAALCGVQNAHIGTISSQWNEADQKPRIKSIKEILRKIGVAYPSAHIEVMHRGTVNYCYPADVCLAVLEYYAFDAGANCQPQARDNFRILAGSKLRDLIYTQVGYDPTRVNTKRFEKWHERIAINYQSAPKGYFHVFNEAHTVIYELIQAGADIGEHFVVDISIGHHWSKYWSDNELDQAFGGRQISAPVSQRPSTGPVQSARVVVLPVAGVGRLSRVVARSLHRRRKIQRVSAGEGVARTAAALDSSVSHRGVGAYSD